MRRAFIPGLVLRIDGKRSPGAAANARAINALYRGFFGIVAGRCRRQRKPPAVRGTAVNADALCLTTPSCPSRNASSDFDVLSRMRITATLLNSH